MEARYCPYCGHPNVSPLKEGFLCLLCGSSFMTSKILREPMAQQERCVNRISPSTLPFLGHALELDRALNSLDVPPTIRDSARAIYRRAVGRETPLDERVAKALASAAIYAAYKKNGVSKSVDEIAAVSGVEKTETEHYYSFLLNEMGYLSPMLNKHEAQPSASARARYFESGAQWEADRASWEREGTQVSYVEKFLEKKGTYEFLRILKESPKRWKTLEKELALSPRTLSERITQSLELGFIEKVRRLKIGATYYRLTKKGNEILEAMTENTSIY